MKLRFRGQVYSKFPKHISNITSDQTASYRGHQYSLRDPLAAERFLSPDYQTSVAIYKYRGVSYVVEHRLRDPVAAERFLSPDYQTSAAIYKYRGVSYVVEHRR